MGVLGWSWKTTTASIKYQANADTAVSHLTLDQIDSYRWDQAQGKWIDLAVDMSGAVVEVDVPPDVAANLTRQRENRRAWYHQPRPPRPAALLPHPQEVPALVPSGGIREGLLFAPKNQEQNKIDLAFTPPPDLMGAPDASRRHTLSRTSVAAGPASGDAAPITVRDLAAAQNEFLKALLIKEASRPPPEIDIHALRAKLAREFERDVRSGLTIHTYPL